MQRNLHFNSPCSASSCLPFCINRNPSTSPSRNVFGFGCCNDSSFDAMHKEVLAIDVPTIAVLEEGDDNKIGLIVGPVNACPTTKKQEQGSSRSSRYRLISNYN